MVDFAIHLFELLLQVLDGVQKCAQESFFAGGADGLDGKALGGGLLQRGGFIPDVGAKFGDFEGGDAGR